MKFWKSIRSYFLVLLALIASPSTWSIDAFSTTRSGSGGGGGGFGTVKNGRVYKALQVLPHYECATAAMMSGLGDLLAQMRRHVKDQTNSNSDPSVAAASSPAGYDDRIASYACLLVRVRITEHACT